MAAGVTELPPPALRGRERDGHLAACLPSMGSFHTSSGPSSGESVMTRLALAALLALTVAVPASA